MNTTQPEKLSFPGATLQRGENYYLVGLEPPAQFLSSAPLGEGLVTASWILSRQLSPSAYLGGPESFLQEPGSYLRLLASQLGVPDDDGMVGLLTSVDHRDLQVTSLSESGITVTSLATVGVDHGSSSRDKDIGVHGEPSTAEAQPLIRPGTINLVTLVDAGLSAGALVRASTVATEAKTLAMVEAGLKTRQGHIATGTATDTTVVGHSGRGEHFRYAGSATLVGWLIGRAVYQSVTLGLAAYNIRKPNR